MKPGPRRVYRLSLIVALALALAYGLGLTLPYLSPLFALMLCANPKPPPGFRGLVGLSLLLVLTLGVGLLLVPLLINYPATALMIVLAGLYLANYLSLNLGKGPVGTLLAAGITMVSAVGLANFAGAITLVQSVVLGVVIAVVCQWLVYPLFPEDPGATAEPPAHSPAESNWLAWRAALIVFPSYLLGLTNPSVYMPLIMKSVTLGQQVSEVDARHAALELVGSTFMGGVLAILFWIGLGIFPSLWMFFLWMLLFGLFVTSRFYGLIPSRFSPAFWLNALITMVIMIGPAVGDSANGKDVYKAFAVRIALFILVSIYALLAIYALEWWRARRLARRRRIPPSQTA